MELDSFVVPATVNGTSFFHRRKTKVLRATRTWIRLDAASFSAMERFSEANEIAWRQSWLKRVCSALGVKWAPETPPDPALLQMWSAMFERFGRSILFVLFRFEANNKNVPRFERASRRAEWLNAILRCLEKENERRRERNEFRQAVNKSMPSTESKQRQRQRLPKKERPMRLYHISPLAHFVPRHLQVTETLLHSIYLQYSQST